MAEHPFIPGARVAISERFSDGVKEAFVEKVYKNGNFTLRGSKQQWSPWLNTFSGKDRWSAIETGSGFGRRRLVIWDSDTDAEISKKVAAEQLRARWTNIKNKIHATSPTTELCDAVEKALASVTRHDRGAAT